MEALILQFSPGRASWLRVGSEFDPDSLALALEPGLLLYRETVYGHLAHVSEMGTLRFREVQ